MVKRRVAKIINSSGFAHEFRIHADAEFVPGPLTGSLLKQGQNNILYCSWQYRTADDHNMKFIGISQQFTDLPDNSLYLPKA